MQHVVLSGGVVLLSCHLIFAAITNWTFDTSRNYLPTDGISYSCASDRDTITSRIFLETGPAASGLDTNLDIRLFVFTQVDNITGESWQEDQGILADTDPLTGKFGCSPGCPGLASGTYYLTLSDGDGTVMGKFNMTGLTEPYRTITGLVTVPAGAPAAFNSVAIGGPLASLSGWTDSTGAYTIGIDLSTVERGGDNLTAFVESRFPGFIPTPVLYRLDLSTSNWNEVNFSFVAANALIRGTTLFENSSVGNIRVMLLDSAGNIVARTISGPDGAYALDCPAGAYRIAAHAADLDPSPVPPGTTITAAAGDSLTHDISLSARDIAAAPPMAADARGKGVLQLTVVDSTFAMVSKGVIMVWDYRPGTGISTRPLRIFPLQEINADLSLMEIPDRPCCISVELTGSVMGSDCRYAAFATDRRGARRIFDYSKNDTQRCAITIRESDRTRTADGKGNVQGCVTVRLPCPADIAVLLYDIDRNSVERGNAVADDGSFRIDHIPPGAYRVVAVIDTNRDKNPDATAAADTVCTFTGAEKYSGISLVFSEKPSGACRISGRITGIGAIPDNVTLTVAALPVDTAKPQALRFDAVAFMGAYRAPVRRGGGFDISDLPAGIYYVVAVAQENDSASGVTGDVAFGIYGDVLLGFGDETPVTPKPVVVAEEPAPKPIVISLIMHGENETDPLVSGSKVTVPREFALQSARIDASGTRLRVDFAVPQPTVAQFSLDDIAGRTIAAIPGATFAPGFHTIAVNVDRRTAPSGAPLFVSMKSDAYKALQAVTPSQPPVIEGKASSSLFPAQGGDRQRSPRGSM